MKAYINNHQVECQTKMLDWQKRGLSFTASGYGSRIPTCYMLRLNGKWRRVYAICYSNCATLYIGKANDKTIVNLEY